jgi:hypothetical protein
LNYEHPVRFVGFWDSREGLWGLVLQRLGCTLKPEREEEELLGGGGGGGLVIWWQGGRSLGSAPLPSPFKMKSFRPNRPSFTRPTLNPKSPPPNPKEGRKEVDATVAGGRAWNFFLSGGLPRPLSIYIFIYISLYPYLIIIIIIIIHRHHAPPFQPSLWGTLLGTFKISHKCSHAAA